MWKRSSRRRGGVIFCTLQPGLAWLSRSLGNRDTIPLMTLLLAEFSAPWSRSVRVVTVASAAGLSVVGLAAPVAGAQQRAVWRARALGVPRLGLLATLPCM